MAELDRLAAAYAELYTVAAAIASDDAAAQVLELRTELEARLAVKNERIEKLRTDSTPAWSARTPSSSSCGPSCARCVRSVNREARPI